MPKTKLWQKQKIEKYKLLLITKTLITITTSILNIFTITHIIKLIIQNIIYLIVLKPILSWYHDISQSVYCLVQWPLYEVNLTECWVCHYSQPDK